MAMGRGPRRGPAPERVRAEVFAVGRRVYVTAGPAGTLHATLMDESDKNPIGRLDDGVEVTILAWRPGWAGAARYHVRATATGRDGWLLGGNIRGTEVAVPPPVVVQPAEPQVTRGGEPSGRRFGEPAYRR